MGSDDNTTRECQVVPLDPYVGKNREELFQIQIDVGGEKNIPNKPAFQAAWKAAARKPAPADIIQSGSISIPQRLKNPEYRFLLVDRQDKKPTEAGWPKYTFDDTRLLSHLSRGGNYGVAPGFGGLCVLDADDPQRLKDLGILDLFAETFTVSNSGGARQHKYFTCNEPPWKKLILVDPELNDDKGHPGHLGEVFCQGNFQVVGPGSVHPSGRRYDVITDVPLLVIARDNLEQIFSQFIKREIPPESVRQYRTERRNTSRTWRLPVLRVEDHLMPDNPETHGDEIQGAHPVHGSETGKNLRINPKKGIWHCFRHHSGGDALLAFAVVEGIIQCHEAQPGALKNKMKEVREALRKRGYLKDEEDSRDHRDRKEKFPKGTPAPDLTEVSAEVHKRAMEILKNEDPIEFMMNAYSRDHIGDTLLGKSYLACIGCTLCTTTGGIHPGTTGKSGSGKTHSMRTMLHQMPPEYVLEGSYSGLAWMYAEIKPGTIILNDDAKNMSDTQKDLVKSATSNYQKGITRIITNTQTKKVDKLSLPERCSFWINSAEGDYGIEFLNRQISLTTNEDHADEIYEKQKEDGITGKPEFTEDDKWKIVVEMHRLLKNSPPITMKIPHLENIEWRNKENSRNYSMFQDTIAGFAAIRQFQRKHDIDGAVIADKEDVDAAMEVWSSISATQRSKLNKKQMRVMQTLVELMKKTKRTEVARPDLLKAMPDITEGGMTHIFNGRLNKDGTREGGLLNLVSGLSVHHETRKDDAYAPQRHVVVYSFVGDLDTWGQFESIVSWKSPS